MENRETGSVEISRGDIFWIEDHYYDQVGAEVRKTRPGVVIQNNIGNHFSGCVIVCMLTAAMKKPLPTHVKIAARGELKPSTIMAEQIFTIDKSRLGRYLGRLTDDEVIQMDVAVKASLGLGEVVRNG